MAWIVRFDGDTAVDLDDLSPSTFDAIAKDDDEASWWGVYAFPGGNAERLYKVISAAAERAGVEPPVRPASMSDARKLLQMLEMKPDLEDEPMQDGFPQTPVAQDLGSSSGAPGDSDGPLTSSDDSQSENS